MPSPVETEVVRDDLDIRHDRDWTQGPILHNVFALAWPSVLSMMLMTAFSITDAFFLGQLGTVPLAAVISATFVVWMIFSALQVVTAGVTALVSRAIGEGRPDHAAYVANQAIWWGVAVAAAIAAVGYIITPAFFDIMATAPDVTHEGIIYLRIAFLGSVFLLLKEVFGAIFQASGDTRRPLIVNTMAVAFNVVLNPILIFGKLGFPRLETAGSAIATVSSFALASLAYALFVRRGALRIPLSLRPPRKPDVMLFWRMVRIGLPLSVGDVIFCTVYLFLNKIVAGYGTFAVAALGIGNRLESLNYMVAHGFGIAAATLVGQNLGAGEPKRAARSAWYTVAVVSVWTGLVGLAFVVFREPLGRVFLDDLLAQAALHSYLILLGATQLFMGAEIVIYFAFAGAGNTLPPSLISIPGAIVRIPIAYLVGETLGFGLDGVWWAITLTMVFRGLLTPFWFSLNRWQKHRV
jgi:putative MATE family efflux protein